MSPVAKPPGTMRRGQMLSVGGPGAMLDLPDDSVIVGGLDSWRGYEAEQVHEPRLAFKIERALKLTGVKLYAPPGYRAEPHAPVTGVGVYRFPLWFVAQGKECEEERPGGVRSRPLVHFAALSKGKLVRNRRNHPVVPVRFVQACPNGHIADVDWYGFVHSGRSACRRPLWLDERGTSGDFADLWVRCDCGLSKNLAAAKGTGALGMCRGLRPWLGHGATEQCVGPNGKAEPARLLIRSASNAYFAQQLSVISIPEQGKEVRAAVASVWEDHLQHLEDVEDLRKERRRPKVQHALDALSNADVWAEIERRRSGSANVVRPIKVDELETLMSSADSIGEDIPDGQFYARAMKLSSNRSPLMQRIERVVLVHRLREVIAQIGFTRFEAQTPDIDGELTLGVNRATLARDVTWVPAVENRGEGVFIVLAPGALAEWEARPHVRERGTRLRRGFERWRAQHGMARVEWPDVRYILLHSLSHLLITAISLEAGYQASSIRERVYVGTAGSGILLHTGSSDAEGTLGGLVEIGRDFERQLRKAVEIGRLCSNDPVCAQHAPDDTHEERYLLGAACHGCVLIGETSCERRNELLDRSLVVPTVESTGAEFFPATEL